MTARTKYQIFISSTYEDLKDERQDIVMACLEMGHIPIGMEMFSAGDSAQWNVIKRTIDECDYYVLLLADRYGSTIAEEGGISYTEKEYDYALERGVPVLGFVLDRGAMWPGDRRESDPVKVGRLAAFKDKAQSRMVTFWKTQAELRGEFAIALTKAFASNPRPGWVPASEAASAKVSEELARLSQENEKLRQEVARLGSVDKGEARLDAIAEQLRAVPSLEEKGMTLLDVFVRLGGAFATQFMVQDVVQFTDETAMMKDLWAMEAIGALASQNTRQMMSARAQFVLTEEGLALLRRVEREQVIKRVSGEGG